MAYLGDKIKSTEKERDKLCLIVSCPYNVKIIEFGSL